jgi:asparagine synthase (glutamine-hydrolysing)
MPRRSAETQLQRMVESICHEAFYNSGIWIDESAGVYVGWAAHQASFGDGMPVRNAREDTFLVFSGEDFHCQDGPAKTKAECLSNLLDLYEGACRFLPRLDGRFHGLLIDTKGGTATLFNDRYGMHQIYYHEAKEGFYFAAEAKAILAVRPELRSVDPVALGELVSCACVLGDRSLFKGIYLLPPAAAWISRQGTLVQKETYFRPKEWEEQSKLDSESYYQEIRRIFSGKLARYFAGSQSVGMSLTGGIDTRMIMAWQKSRPGSLPCYTFGGTYRDCRDVVMAKRVAEVCEQPHEVITIGKEFLSRFPRYAERTVYLTDGCADVSRSPALYGNERAREIAPVRMTGVYGSEVLRRLRSFKAVDPPPDLFHPGLLSHVQSAKDKYQSLLDLHPVSFTVFRPTPQRAVDTLEQSQLVVRTPFLDGDIVRTAFRAPDSSGARNDASADNNVCLRLIADGNQVLGRIPTDRGLGGTKNGIRGAASRALLEFTFKSEYAYDYGMPQFVARVDHVLSPLHIERLFLGRHKFQHFRVWYRDDLSGYVQEMLLDSRALGRPYVTRKGVEMIVHAHVKGNRNFTTEIHRLLSLELMHRLFVDAA